MSSDPGSEIDLEQEDNFDPNIKEMQETNYGRVHLNINNSKLSKKKIGSMIKRKIQKMVHINILNSPKGFQSKLSPLVTKIGNRRREIVKAPWKHVANKSPQQMLNTTIFTKK